MRVARKVGEAVVMVLKVRCDAARPSQLCPAVNPMIDPPRTAAYPAGHSLQSYLISYCLQRAMPEPAAVGAAASARGEHGSQLDRGGCTRASSDWRDVSPTTAWSPACTSRSTTWRDSCWRGRSTACWAVPAANVQFAQLVATAAVQFPQYSMLSAGNSDHEGPPELL